MTSGFAIMVDGHIKASFESKDSADDDYDSSAVLKLPRDEPPHISRWDA